MDDSNDIKTAELNFCTPCSELQVKDVKEQLRALFTVRNIHTDMCGICRKRITLKPLTRGQVKREAKALIDDDDDDDGTDDDGSGSVEDHDGDVDDSDDDEDFKPDPKMLDAAAADDDDELDSAMSDEDPDFKPDPTITTEGKSRAYELFKGRSGVHPTLLEMMKPVRNPKRPFNCKLCKDEDQEFGFLLHFQRHLKTHTGKDPIEEPYYCEQCDMTFSGRGVYKIHMFKQHAAERPFQCSREGCNARGFTNKSAYNTHMQMHADVRPFKCKECKKRFRSKTELKKHGYYHTGTRNYNCKYCNKGFYTKRTMEDHLSMHTGEKPFQCKQCPYTCRLIKMLVSHQKIHERQKVHCDRCKRVFKFQVVLDKHIKINKCKPPRPAKIKVKLELVPGNVDITYITQCLDPVIQDFLADPVSEEKPFKCKVCTGKRARLFHNPGPFIKHASTHVPDDGYSESKPFKCPDCDSRFRTWNKIETHRAVHMTVKSVPCRHPECEGMFKSHLHMMQHMRTVHSAKHCICEVCGASFNTNEKLKSHMYRHKDERPIKCDECDQMFKNNNKLCAHKRRVHSKGPLLMCELCGKAFRHRDGLTTHIKVHTAEKRHACHLCEYRCKRGDNLKKHMKIHFKNDAGSNVQPHRKSIEEIVSEGSDVRPVKHMVHPDITSEPHSVEIGTETFRAVSSIIRVPIDVVNNTQVSAGSIVTHDSGTNHAPVQYLYL